jgi:hypothetical protein
LEFGGGKGLGGATQDAAFGIHGDRVAAGEGGVRIERAEEGGVSIESGTEIAQTAGGGAVHRLARGGKLDAELGNFTLGIVTRDGVEMTLEGYTAGLNGIFGQRMKFLCEAVEGLAVLAETAGWLEEKGGPLE